MTKALSKIHKLALDGFQKALVDVLILGQHIHPSMNDVVRQAVQECRESVLQGVVLVIAEHITVRRPS